MKNRGNDEVKTNKQPGNKWQTRAKVYTSIPEIYYNF